MAHEANSDGRKRRIELPSGKVIEVFKPRPASTTPAGGRRARSPKRARETAPRRVEAEPNACPECDSQLVYPVSWDPAPLERWSADLRCPNCERRATVTLTQAAAERFDEELERGVEQLERDLARLTELNMSEHVERFVAALEADAIQPIDF